MIRCKLYSLHNKQYKSAISNRKTNCSIIHYECIYSHSYRHIQLCNHKSTEFVIHSLEHLENYLGILHIPYDYSEPQQTLIKLLVISSGYHLKSNKHIFSK